MPWKLKEMFVFPVLQKAAQPDPFLVVKNQLLIKLLILS